MTNELDAGRAIEILEDDELEQANEAMGKSLFDQAAAILQGIDAEESANANGWWETSVGAKFGAEKLRELRALLEGRASLPVGVPDGLAIALFNALEAYEATRDSFPALKDKAIHADQCGLLRQHASQMLASPTVKAEQWKCEQCGAGTGESCNANGCFANERSADAAPSLPAAGSAVQAKALRAYDQPTRVAIKMLERTLSPTAMEIAAELRRCLGDAQDALSAQQSAPELVSVPVELLERIAGKGCDPDCCIAYWREQLRALLASHGRGEA